MVRRFVMQLKDATKEFESVGNQDIPPKISNLLSLVAYPTLDDFHETMESILNLQQFYGLKPSKLVHGRILTIQANASLNAIHALEIGKFALSKKQYTLSLSWLYAAKDLYRDAGMTSSVEIDTLVTKLVDQHDTDYDSELSTGLYFFEEKLSNNMSARTMREVKMKNYYGIAPSGHESYQGDVAYYNLLNICNGNEFVPESVKKTLFCRLETKQNPYFAINPIKMEVLSHDPYAVMMHKVFPKYYFRSTWSSSASAAVVKSSVSLASLELEAAGLSKMSHEASDPRPGSTYRIVAAINKAHFKDTALHPGLVSKMEFLTKVKIKGKASDTYVINSYLHGTYIHTTFMHR
ncbi:uncharacterized protein LOC110843904 [Folsomia candida]|uniref:uncharacterized protein LOC110843904 n=1 Tax=Folsomia candida TaxID=158441 RepID=UPI001604C555|nr:uncharacterized protein LOC110843904 [Folsomia candida]